MTTKNNKNKYFFILNNFSCKFIFILSALLVIFGTLNINPAFAYFSDEATIEGTTFQAGTLGITIDSEDAIDFGLMYPSDSQSASIGISNTGTLDSQYIFNTIPTGDDNEACDYITATGTNSIDNTNIYTGTISNFTSIVENTIDKTWNFDLKVNDNAPASVWGKTCSFKWKYTAWQTDLVDSSMGFTSVKEKIGEIKIGKAVVMNEILPNPEGLDTQAGLQGEWVELYNNSNIPIELSGWKIKDAAGHEIIISSSNTWNGRTIIKPKGSDLEWVVVFMNSDVMNNTGDIISFYNSTGGLVDQYSYGNSGTDDDSDSNNTGGGDNDNPSGSETAGNEGKSDARIPDGTGAWRDPIPTPGKQNVDNSEEEVISTSVEPEKLSESTTPLEEIPQTSTETPAIKIEENDTEIKDEEIVITEELIEQDPLIKEKIVNTEVVAIEEPVIEKVKEEVVKEEPIGTE